MDVLRRYAIGYSNLASAVALSATANNMDGSGGKTNLKVQGDLAVANKSTVHIIVHKLTTGATSATNEWKLQDALDLIDYYASIGLKNITPTQVLSQT